MYLLNVKTKERYLKVVLPESNARLQIGICFQIRWLPINNERFTCDKFITSFMANDFRTFTTSHPQQSSTKEESLY